MNNPVRYIDPWGLSALEQRYVHVESGRNLNVRALPNTNSEIVDTLERGDEVTVVVLSDDARLRCDEGFRWVPIVRGNRLFWVADEFLGHAHPDSITPAAAVTRDGAVTLPALPDMPNFIGANLRFVQPDDGLDLQSGPWTDARVLETIGRGFDVRLTGNVTTDNDGRMWVSVNYLGTDGWMPYDFLGETVPWGDATVGTTLTEVIFGSLPIFHYFQAAIGRDMSLNFRELTPEERIEALNSGLQIVNDRIESGMFAAPMKVVGPVPGGALPNNARTTTDVNEVFRRLELYHGIDPNVASMRLHDIKRQAGMGGADNVLFDLTGNVFHPVTGEWLDTLTR